MTNTINEDKIKSVFANRQDIWWEIAMTTDKMIYLSQEDRELLLEFLWAIYLFLDERKINILHDEQQYLRKNLRLLRETVLDILKKKEAVKAL